MPPDRDATLERLLSTLRALRARRAETRRQGIRGLRLDAIDLEINEVEEAIRVHCVAMGRAIPRFIGEHSRARRTFLQIALRGLETQLRLLALRVRQREAALHHGELARASQLSQAIRRDRASIRKHCERARLPLPPEALEAD